MGLLIALGIGASIAVVGMVYDYNRPEEKERRRQIRIIERMQKINRIR